MNNGGGVNAGLLVLANALFMAQRWEDAAPVLERLLTAQPDNNVALLLQANNLYLLGETGKAEQILLKVLARTSADTDAASSLGRIYYMENRAEFAAGHCTEKSFPYVGQGRRVFIREGDKPHIVRGAKPFEFLSHSFRVTMTPADPKTVLPTVSATVRTTPRELNDNGAPQSEALILIPILD